MSDFDRRIPISISLPQSVLDALDKKRAAMPRSRYVLRLLEKALKDGKKKVD